MAPDNEDAPARVGRRTADLLDSGDVLAGRHTLIQIRRFRNWCPMQGRGLKNVEQHYQLALHKQTVHRGA
jgi:hypothetical protein